MLNDHIDYGKRSFRSYLHTRVVIFKQCENGFKSKQIVLTMLNDRVDHVD